MIRPTIASWESREPESPPPEGDGPATEQRDNSGLDWSMGLSDDWMCLALEAKAFKLGSVEAGMDRISYLIHRLKKHNARVRRDACERLSRVPELPGKAILALKKAVQDPDPHVAKAAGRALSVHEQNLRTSPFKDQIEAHHPTSDYPWSWIGNLHPAHVLFLIVGLFMIFQSADWSVSLFILLFLAGCISVMGLAGQSRHQKLIEAWSELARETRLRLDPGHFYFLGESLPPSINGIYRGRRIFINKKVKQISVQDGDIPVVYTCMQLAVKNTANYRLSMGSKSSNEQPFKHSMAGSGDSPFDKHFSFMGNPPEFVQRACLLIMDHHILLERPDGVIMLTDYPFSWTNWSRPTIELKGYQLACLQSGIPTGVPGQIEILDLLCDLAELVENTARPESN